MWSLSCFKYTYRCYRNSFWGKKERECLEEEKSELVLHPIWVEYKEHHIEEIAHVHKNAGQCEKEAAESLNRP